MEIREFGIKLKELRNQAGLSQRELGDKVGVNFTYLSKIENGVLPPPSQKVILRLAEVLNADIDELMTLAGKISPDITQMLKNREILRLLRSARVQRKARSAR
ncbi:MAG: helix-turn-helix transcriptional regulator [Chloroflexi bacterium]|nr:helix-turn-helix transcriptional regulator [Chloroflexota bacterium]MBI2979778.1 helix-turn-helix transcriptional regulator [Chloroflexota bacterium]